MFVIIVGGGHLAVGLARFMSSRKDDVVIIDRKMNASKLGQSFDGIIVDGDPMDIATLESTGIQQCDLFIAVTGDDNVNAACAQAAKVLFKVPKVLARIADPARESFYRSIGLSVVCPTVTGINEVLDWLAADSANPIEASLDPSTICIRPRKEWIGKDIRSVSESVGFAVLGIIRKGVCLPVSRQSLIDENDTLIVSMKQKKGLQLL